MLVVKIHTLYRIGGASYGLFAKRHLFKVSIARFFFVWWGGNWRWNLLFRLGRDVL